MEILCCRCEDFIVKYDGGWFGCVSVFLEFWEVCSGRESVGFRLRRIVLCFCIDFVLGWLVVGI